VDRELIKANYNIDDASLDNLIEKVSQVNSAIGMFKISVENVLTLAFQPTAKELIDIEKINKLFKNSRNEDNWKDNLPKRKRKYKRWER